MKKLFFLFSIVVFLSNFSGLQAQKTLSFTFSGRNQPQNFDLKLSEPYFKNKNNQAERDSQIKNIQNFGGNSGIAYTSDTIFRTDDNGETWRKITLPLGLHGKIGTVYFENNLNGLAVLSIAGSSRVYLAETSDGGNNWTTTPISLRNEDLAETDLKVRRLKF